MDKYTDLPTKRINYALHGKLMLCTAILIFIALFIILCFHNSARSIFSNRRRRSIRRRRAQHILSLSTAINTPNSAANSKGLDPSVIKTIPTCIYSDRNKARHFTQLDCAVCLSEFENNEEARVLPNCNHAFHVDCIDMWFHSHSNCPLCRAPVQVDIPVDPPKTLEHTVVEVIEPEGSVAPSDQDIEINSSSGTASSSSSSSFSMESCPMKTLELVVVWDSCGGFQWKR